MQLFQPVRLRVDMPEAGLRRGAVGRVLDLFDDDPQHVEVEFHKSDGSEHGLYVEHIVPRVDLEVLPSEQESPGAGTSLEIDGESERLVEWPESDGDEPEGG